MEQILLCRLENWSKEEGKEQPVVIVSAPSDTLWQLQEDGYAVLAELSHLQGHSEEEIAETLCKEEAVSKFTNVCICAEALPQAYLRRIWCQAHQIPVQIAETERLFIRESVLEDASAFLELYQDAESRRYLELPLAQTKMEYEQYIRAYQQGQYAFWEYGMWTVVEKKQGQVIGRVGLEQQDEAVSLGYAILPQFRGKGYALEACKAVLVYAKECEYAETIAVTIHTENEASKHVADTLQKQSDMRLEVRLVKN